MITSPSRNTPCAGPEGTTEATRATSSKPNLLKTTASALLCELAICALVARLKLSRVTFGGNTSSRGTTSEPGSNNELNKNHPLISKPGPPYCATVVKSNAPCVGYVLASSTEIIAVPSKSPNVFTAGPARNTTNGG